MEREAKLAIFLGSGASASFDKPVTKKLREELVKEHGTGLDSFLSGLFACTDLYDFEEILTAAYEIRDFLSGSKGGRFVRFLGSNRLQLMRFGHYIPFNDTYSEWADVIEKLEDDVYTFYRWDYNFTDLAKETYTKFLDYLSNDFGRIFIGTTNYDRAIENAFGSRDSKYRAVDGFEHVRGELQWTGRFFHPERIEGIIDIDLCKIHGSLGWKRRKHDNMVVNTLTESRVVDTNYSKNVVIYPTLSPKHFHNDPLLKGIFLEFETQLKDSDACIVIGFSFRDLYINKYFLEFEKKRKPVIVILPPDSIDDAIRNLFPNEKFEGQAYDMDYLKLPNHLIYFIPAYFQSENLDKINEVVSAIFKEMGRVKKMAKQVDDLVEASSDGSDLKANEINPQPDVDLTTGS